MDSSKAYKKPSFLKFEPYTPCYTMHVSLKKLELKQLFLGEAVSFWVNHYNESTPNIEKLYPTYCIF